MQTFSRPNSITLLRLMAVVIGVSYWGLPAANHDLGWHLFGGWYVTTHHTVPTYDPVNSFNPLWHDYHWLGQIFLFKLFDAGGYPLIRLALGLLTAWLFLVMTDIALLSLRRRANPAAPFAVCAGSLLLIMNVPDSRPHMFSLLVLALVLRDLVRRPSDPPLIRFFLYSIFLVNVHIYWIFVPFLWFAYICIPRIMQRHGHLSGLRAWGGLALLSSSGFFSPYGIFMRHDAWLDYAQNYLLLFEYMQVPDVLRDSVGELQSGLSQHGLPLLIFLSYSVIMVRSLRLRRILAEPTHCFVAITLFLLSIGMRKYCGPAAILSIPYFARHSLARRDFFCEHRLWSRLVRPIGLAAALCYFGFLALRDNPYASDDIAMLRELYPIEACEAIAARRPRPRSGREHVRILTSFNDGGWCRWVMHLSDPTLDARVTTDNRTQWVPGRHYEISSRLFLLATGWKSYLEAWDPDFLVVPGLQPLAGRLLDLPERWERIFVDRRTVVFKPQEPR